MYFVKCPYAYIVSMFHSFCSIHWNPAILLSAKSQLPIPNISAVFNFMKSVNIEHLSNNPLMRCPTLLPTATKQYMIFCIQNGYNKIVLYRRSLTPLWLSTGRRGSSGPRLLSVLLPQRKTCAAKWAPPARTALKAVGYNAVRPVSRSVETNRANRAIVGQAAQSPGCRGQEEMENSSCRRCAFALDAGDIGFRASETMLRQ